MTRVYVLIIIAFGVRLVQHDTSKTPKLLRWNGTRTGGFRVEPRTFPLSRTCFQSLEASRRTESSIQALYAAAKATTTCFIDSA